MQDDAIQKQQDVYKQLVQEFQNAIHQSVQALLPFVLEDMNIQAQEAESRIDNLLKDISASSSEIISINNTNSVFREVQEFAEPKEHCAVFIFHKNFQDDLITKDSLHEFNTYIIHINTNFSDFQLRKFESN